MIDALLALTGRPGLDGLLAAIAAWSLKASLLVLAAAAVTLAWRGASAATRHLVWTLALGGALVMPFASRLLPRVELALVPDVSAFASEAAPTVAADAGVSARASASETIAASMTAPTATPASPVVANPALPARAVPPRASEAIGGRVGTAWQARVEAPVDATADTPAAVPTAPRWRALLVAIWAIGAALVLVPVLLGRLRVLLLARRARPLAGGAWSDLVEIAIARTGLAREVRVLESPDSTMPMTWGIMKPVVLLPADAERWGEQQRMDVLLHELAHVARLDCLTQVIAQLACAVHWFNPLVWLAARRTCVEREHACDDRVLAAGTRPSDYASHLLEVARSMRVGAVAPLGAVAMARRAQLSERLLAVLDARRSRSGVSRRVAFPAWATAMTLVLVLGAMAPAGADASSARHAGDVPAPASSDTDSVAAVGGGSGRGGSGGRGATAGGVAATGASGGGAAVGGAAAGDARGEGGASGVGGPATAISGSITGARGSFTINGTTVNVSGGQSVSASDGVVKVDGKVVWDSKGESGMLRLGDAGTAAPALAAAAANAPRGDCGDAKGSSSHINVENDGRKEMRVSWKSERCSVSIEIEGDVTIAPDLTDIVSLARGAFVEIVERTDESVRRLELRNRGGQVERKYSVDGSAREWDAEGRRWLAALLLDLERRTGSFAKERVAQLHAAGGAQAVLAEIGRLSGDHARRRYFMELFALDTSLDDAAIARAIGQAARQIASDYELRVVLGGAVKEPRFADASVAAFADAIRSLKSDYERRVAVTSLLGEGRTLPTSALRTVLTAAQGMTSAYEMRVILAALAKQRALDAEAIGLYASAVETMNSDYERRVALVAVLDRDLDERSLAALLRATRGMRSDYERRVVLTEAVKHRSLSGEAQRAFDDAVDAIRSDYERGVVLNAARRRARTNEM